MGRILIHEVAKTVHDVAVSDGRAARRALSARRRVVAGEG
jgi:hypothetical protein